MRAFCCEESMTLTRLHRGQAYGTCFLEGFAAGFGEAESGGGGRRGGRHHRAGAAVHLVVALLRRSSRRGGVSAGRGGRRGRHWRHERRRGRDGVGRAVVVAFQRPGHIDAEIEP